MVGWTKDKTSGGGRIRQGFHLPRFLGVYYSPWLNHYIRLFLDETDLNWHGHQFHDEGEQIVQPNFCHSCSSQKDSKSPTGLMSHS